MHTHTHSLTHSQTADVGRQEPVDPVPVAAEEPRGAREQAAVAPPGEASTSTVASPDPAPAAETGREQGGQDDSAKVIAEHKWLTSFNQRARLDNGYVVISHFVESVRQTMQLRLPLNQATAWRSKLRAGEYYSIGSLLVLMANQDLKGLQLAERFSQVGVPDVGINERREIVAYFTDQK